MYSEYCAGKRNIDVWLNMETKPVFCSTRQTDSIFSLNYNAVVQHTLYIFHRISLVATTFRNLAMLPSPRVALNLFSRRH